jgi:hypothetical protein
MRVSGIGALGLFDAFVGVMKCHEVFVTGRSLAVTKDDLIKWNELLDRQITYTVLVEAVAVGE